MIKLISVKTARNKISIAHFAENGLVNVATTTCDENLDAIVSIPLCDDVFHYMEEADIEKIIVERNESSEIKEQQMLSEMCGAICTYGLLRGIEIKIVEPEWKQVYINEAELKDIGFENFPAKELVQSGIIQDYHLTEEVSDTEAEAILIGSIYAYNENETAEIPKEAPEKVPDEGVPLPLENFSLGNIPLGEILEKVQGEIVEE